MLQNEGAVEFYSDIIKISNHKIEKGCQIFDAEIRGKLYKNIKLNKIGRAHLLNYTLALAGVLDVCGDIKNIEVSEPLPYRMELVNDSTIIDTSHNGASFNNFLQSIKSMGWNDIVLYITILEGKELSDIADVFAEYKDIINRIEFFEFESGKKSNAEGLYELVKNCVPSLYHKDISEIILDKERKKAFSGSFYSIPQIMGLLPHIRLSL